MQVYTSRLGRLTRLPLRKRIQAMTASQLHRLSANPNPTAALQLDNSLPFRRSDS